eukprot:6195958-Amphidinium_carterae.1
MAGLRLQSPQGLKPWKTSRFFFVRVRIVQLQREEHIKIPYESYFPKRLRQTLSRALGISDSQS